MKCKAEGCDRKALSKGCCDMHYRRILKRGSIDSRGSRNVDLGSDAERFHKKYVVNEDTGCWMWIGGSRGKNPKKMYGRHWLSSGKTVSAHRFSVTLHGWELSEDNYVCHKCDTPLCVNPDHLFVSDHKGNMKDMTSKGRSYRGRGEDKKGLAKLTNEQAEEIRKMPMSQSKIALIYGVSQTTIGRIKRGVSY